MDSSQLDEEAGDAEKWEELDRSSCMAPSLPPVVFPPPRNEPTGQNVLFARARCPSLVLSELVKSTSAPRCSSGFLLPSMDEQGRRSDASQGDGDGPELSEHQHTQAQGDFSG